MEESLSLVAVLGLGLLWFWVRLKLNVAAERDEALGRQVAALRDQLAALGAGQGKPPESAGPAMEPGLLSTEPPPEPVEREVARPEAPREGGELPVTASESPDSGEPRSAEEATGSSAGAGVSAAPPAAEAPVETIPTAASGERAPGSLWSSIGLPQLARGIDWEQVLGVKIFSWLAGLAVLVSAVLFAGWSVEHGFVTPPVRMALGTLCGLALVVVSETRWAQRYRITMQSLAAGGIAALFSTFFAAHARWHLIPAGLAFALLALVAATAVLLAVRRDAVVVAILGLLGGFATPILLSTGENRPLGLFSYLLLLNVGLTWVAHKKRWPILSAASLLFTAAYQAGWVSRFLDASQLPLALGLFLLFPVVGFAGLALARRDGELRGPDSLARWTAVAGAVPPALFALYVAGSGEFGSQWPLLLGFLALVALGLAVVAAWQGPEWLHLAGAGSVLVTLAAFMARSFTADGWPLLALFLAIFVAIYLGTPLVLERLGRDYRAEGRLGRIAAPLVITTFAIAAHVGSARAPGSFLLPLLLLAGACSAFALSRGDGRVHLLGGAAALVGEASWSAFHLDAATLYPALVAYASFAALFLVVPYLAERRGRPLVAGQAGPLLLGCLALLAFIARGPASDAIVGSLAGITLLTLLFLAALFREAKLARAPLLGAVGVIVGFVVFLIWAGTGLYVAPLPALLAAAGLAGMALAGPLVAGGSHEDPGVARGFQAASHLGFAGHLFVLVVAAQPSLAYPPYPWLAVLLVLDLGCVVASLYRGRDDLLLGAAELTVLVLLVHQIGLGLVAPATAVAGWAGLGAAALFLAVYLLARRIGATPARGLTGAGTAALVALHGAQLLLLVGTARGELLPLSFLLPAHVALAGGLLALAWISSAEEVSLSAAAVGALAAPLLWPWGHGLPGDALWLATPLWLLALVYPLARGSRARTERLPFLAAVVASGAFLLVARKALMALGAGPYMGALPVVQAALLVPHLIMLLRMEPPTDRDMGRLALVAAAILALVTVAIPLQLEKQWWTIGWAVQAAALAWLWRRIPHPGLLVWSAALFGAAFVRLVPFLNVWIFEYHRRGSTPIWNWYLYTYLVSASSCFLGAWFFSRGDDRIRPGWPRLSKLLGSAGALLLFFLVNVEIADYWSEGGEITFRFSAGLGSDLSYTIAWALFALGLLAAGVLLGNRGARVAAIGLLTITVLKGFLHDLSRLSGLQRIASFVGLAVCLALVALVLQRFVLRASDLSSSTAPSQKPPEAP